MEETRVAIVGAGPNGLAVASHLAVSGVDRVVMGQPLSSWRHHMPRGMLLKSEPYGSDIAAPFEGYRVSDFCRLRGIEYRERGLPVSRETFIDYGDWYSNQLVPDVRTAMVSDIVPAEHGFHLTTGEGDRWAVEQVVVATGLMPFIYIPPALRQLPRHLATHAWAHADLARFAGRRVAVIGAGQSALETAVLLHELGADVEVIARVTTLGYARPNPQEVTAWSRIRRPVTRTGDGWRCWCYHCLPGLFRLAPTGLRVRKAMAFLGPSGAPWIRPRLEGKVMVRTATHVVAAEDLGGRARLNLEGREAGVEAYDHVIAATGYRLDVDRLAFISSALRADLEVAGGAPVLSPSFESSVPGLYFVGAMAAPSLGPSMRFLSGTHFTARRISRAISDTGRLAPSAKWRRSRGMHPLPFPRSPVPPEVSPAEGEVSVR